MVGIDIKIVLVLRNPFDQISTSFKKRRKDYIQPQKGRVNFKDTRAVEMHLPLYRLALRLMKGELKRYKWHVMTMENFAEHTREELDRLCAFTGMDCSAPELVNSIVNATRHEIHRSRFEIEWSKSQQQTVHAFIAKKLSKWYSPNFDAE